MTLVASWYGGCSAKAMRPLLVPLLAVSLLAGCSAPAADEDAAYSAEAEGALTLADGDRYVVRADAQSGEVVLRTSVDGVPLPYDAPAMLGKALLIHPLPGRADEGIYARVTSATRVQGEGRLDSGDTLRLTTTPLSLEEMAGLSEDDVLRIYLARGLRGGSLEPASLSLLDVGGTPPANTSANTPANTGAWSGLLSGQLPMVSVVPPNANLGAFVGNVDLGPLDLSFKPEGKLAYRRESGLEIGLRGEMRAKMEITVSGMAGVRAPIFVTPDAKLPPVTFLVPIGPFPVPVQLGVSGNLRCDLLAGGRVAATVALGATVRFGGSSRFNPTKNTLPTNWIQAGEWPYELDASFEASATGDVDPAVGIACVVPRVNLDVRVAGVAGPYLALVPQVASFADRTEARPSLRAGWASGTLLFGSPARAEVELIGKTYRL